MVVPREAGMTIFIKRIPNELRDRETPCKVMRLVVITIMLAGIGTMICSKIHPKKTAQAPLLIINDSKPLNTEYNIIKPLNID
jgi:hypothetical protein